MSEAVNRSVKCAECSTVLDPENTSRACPNCGSEARIVNLHVRDSLSVSIAEKVMLATTREFYKKNRPVFLTVIGITVVSPFLGLVLFGWVGVVVGLVLGALSFFLSPLAVTKVREIKERTT